MTYDEYMDATCETVRLMIWFARHWLAQHPHETFVHVLRERTDIFRKTDLYRQWPVTEGDYEQTPWAKAESGLLGLCRETLRDADSRTFEDQGLAILRPHLEARARLLAPDGFNTLPRSTQCGSLRYDPPKPEAPRRIPFHIGNALRPCSIFDDPAHLPACLRCLMQKSAAEFAADSLSTTTWLNSYPKWLRLFPPEWQRNLGPEMHDVRTGMGYWGQFVSGRGAFNHKHARILRQTGRLPYPPRHSWCTFDALEKHLLRTEP